jgi:hypothetical protein
VNDVSRAPSEVAVSLLATLLIATALGQEPAPELSTLPPPTAPPCLGPLTLEAPPCRFFSTLGTFAGWTIANTLSPADRRLVRASSVSPRGDGSIWNSRARTEPGLLFSGFSSSPTFVGIGSFDMRDVEGP